MGAVLLGSGVVPGPGDLQAFGWASVTRGSAPDVICYHLSITRGAPTTALLARGAPGEAGTKLADLIGPTMGHDSYGCEAFDPATVTDLLTDRPAGAARYFIALGDVNGELVRGPLVPGGAPLAIQIRGAAGRTSLVGSVTWQLAGPGPEAASLLTALVAERGAAVERAVVRRGSADFTISELADLLARPRDVVLEVAEAGGTVARRPLWRVDLGAQVSQPCVALPGSATDQPPPWPPLVIGLIGLMMVVGRAHMRARTTR